jgi:hypothetical protein
LLNAPRQLLRQARHIFVGLKTANTADLSSHQISDHDVGTGCADIHANDAPLTGINVQKGRSASASDRFTKSAFKYQSFLEEFANQQTGDAPPDLHQPGQIGSGNWLMSADQVKNDLPVDLTTSAAASDCEIMRVYLAHLLNCLYFGLNASRASRFDSVQAQIQR